MQWLKSLNGNPLPWLLESDPANPSIRYFALRDLLDRPEDDAETRSARAAIMTTGPVPVILAAQNPAGFWEKSGSGYSPKYRATTWQVFFLGELGADPAEERVQSACDYVLSHSIAANHAFSAYNPPVPSGAVHCLNGNLLYALQRLGFGADPRVQAALAWLARAATGEAPMTYLKSGPTGPGFACSVNMAQPCGWGATKAMRALLAIPPDLRTQAIQSALETGAAFLLSHDPAVADYPYTERVSSTWFKFGFPLSYWSDVLETVDVLADMGHGRDPRLDSALGLILSKQDAQGRWKIDNSVNGKMWVDIEVKGKPSKWITLRALRVLKRVAEDRVN